MPGVDYGSVTTWIGAALTTDEMLWLWEAALNGSYLRYFIWILVGVTMYALVVRVVFGGKGADLSGALGDPQLEKRGRR